MSHTTNHSFTMVCTKRTACNYDGNVSPSGLVLEKQNKNNKDEVIGYSNTKKRGRSEKNKVKGSGKESKYAPTTVKNKKPHRYRPGLVAITEIRRPLSD